MGPPTQEEAAGKPSWGQTPCRGCDGEDTQGEGPSPRSVGAVFNSEPWDSSSASGLVLGEAGFCSWPGCSPGATSASKGLVSASQRVAQRRPQHRKPGILACVPLLGLLCASYSARKGYNMDAKKTTTQGEWTTDQSFDDKLRVAWVTSALLTAGSLEPRDVPGAQELLKAREPEPRFCQSPHGRQTGPCLSKDPAVTLSLDVQEDPGLVIGSTTFPASCLFSGWPSHLPITLTLMLMSPDIGIASLLAPGQAHGSRGLAEGHGRHQQPLCPRLGLGCVTPTPTASRGSGLGAP